MIGNVCCCVQTCVIDTQEFSADGEIQGFTVALGDASQSGGVATIDPASVLITSKSSERPHMAVEAAFSIDTEDVYIELRICWNTATDEYLFGRIYTAAAGEQAGRFEIGIYDGATETILQGPWYRSGLVKDTTHTANLCYDGETLCLDVAPNGVQSERCAAKVPSFTSPDGAKAGIATDSSLATYELHEWTFRRQADDPDNPNALWCVTCESCRQWTKTGIAFLTWDEYETSASVDWTIFPSGGLRWLTAGTVLSRNIYYTANIHRQHTFYVSFPGGTGTWRFRFLFWYENASNYWYVDCPHPGSGGVGSPTVALYQVVGGVHTEQDSTDFRSGGQSDDFTVRLCLSDDSISVQIEQHGNVGGNVVTRVSFGLDDGVTAPEGWQIGVEADAGCRWWSHGHICVGNCEICAACETGFGAESYLVEVTGSPCPFEDMDGTYATAGSQVELEEGAGFIIPRCTYFIYTTSGGGLLLSGAKISIPTEPSDHPVYGASQQGHLASVTLYLYHCDPRWWHRLALKPHAAANAEREAAIGEYCSAGSGSGDDCDGSWSAMRTSELTFYYWLPENEMPMDCDGIDWTIGFYDVFDPPEPTTPQEWPGVDFSSMSVRVRSLPLP